MVFYIPILFLSLPIHYLCCPVSLKISKISKQTKSKATTNRQLKNSSRERMASEMHSGVGVALLPDPAWPPLSIRKVSPAPPSSDQDDPHFQQPWEAVALRILSAPL